MAKSTINDRIRKVMDYLGSNYRSFAKMLETSDVVVGNVIKGRNNPSFNLMFKIIQTNDWLNARWFLTGEGSMLIDDEKKAAVKSENGISLIPTDAFAGLSSGDVSINDYDIQDRYVIPDFNGEVDFMIRVKGSSMYPKYNSGDVVACKMIVESQFIQWNKVHVIATKEQGVLIKRLKKCQKNQCMLAISDNPKYDPFEIPKDEILNLALVIGVIRLE